MVRMTMNFNKWLHPIKWYKSRTIRLILQKEMDKWMSEHEEDFQNLIRDFHLYGYAIVDKNKWLRKGVAEDLNKSVKTSILSKEK